MGRKPLSTRNKPPYFASFKWYIHAQKGCLTYNQSGDNVNASLIDGLITKPYFQKESLVQLQELLIKNNSGSENNNE